MAAHLAEAFLTHGLNSFYETPSKSDGSDCLCYLDSLVNTHSHPKDIDYPFEFLIHFVGDKTDADMSFDAFLCEVENGTRLKRTL